MGLPSGLGLSCCVQPPAAAAKHTNNNAIPNIASLERIMVSLYPRIRAMQGVSC